MPGNFGVADEPVQIPVYGLIITKAMSVSISKEGQNMTETDINYSESFIYQIGKKVYHKFEAKTKISKSSVRLKT